ncbi:1,2-phenylacetyl-CoA epoxidase subunit PaaE [Nakamurella aerolata]|uniref:Phenylacetate-CoA oxygenase/reductase subunit PaaK n=1 Tax=Nakamurella aerolata TaxID=1656892 RepID=A0A849AF57_9ACTN|nr:1,2-phenylacetyl-CoA epoxidase subunit PaaE [Nakamurella aerolata]NNG37100.1 phenylacetate-CoA oxygenase/reductase subunit PaaK [Nakamurella aerolata]
MSSTKATERRRLRFHPLPVKAVNRLTADAVEVVFAIPGELDAEYGYLPGQHVAVRHRHDGTEIRRSYSLCAPAGNGELHIAVKAEPGGIYSTYATSDLSVGDVVEVMTPQGSFTSKLRAGSGAHVAAVAAGSGITPVLALATGVLRDDPDATFSLIYSSRSADQVMFVDALADLKDRYPSRFSLHHILTREQRQSPVHSGRLDPEKLSTVLEYMVRPDSVDEWFLCGPVELVRGVRGELLTRGSDPNLVHTELFSTGEEPVRRKNIPPVSGHGAAGRPQVDITLTLDGRTSTVQSPAGSGERILDAALRSRSDVPFACAGGVCGTCRAKLVDGTVDMATNYALEPDELAAGYILTCQSEPTSSAVTVDYDS